MLLAPLPAPGELWNTIPLPSDVALVHDGDLVGTCTIAYARPMTLPAHIEIHLERRGASGSDPCATADGFTQLDVTTDFSAAAHDTPTIVARRCPTAIFTGPSAGRESCVLGSLGLVLPADSAGHDVNLNMMGCALDGPEGAATLDGTITMGNCVVVQ